MTALDPASVAATGAAIAAVQLPDGLIPWFPGGHADPWDHVEAAMGLDCAGRPDEAAHAYEWLRRHQNPDGSWYAGYRDGRVVDDTREANFAAYVCVGTWHHYLSTGDEAFLDRMWPVLVSAVDFVLGLQSGLGEIRWARDAGGRAADEALLAGCASMYQSLRCAIAVAARRDEPQPDWELAAAGLGHVLRAHPDRFAPRDRYAMDWYYPVLGGALSGPAGRSRIEGGWDRFVVADLGVRCVDDRPWVTGAETCELVLALWALGDRDRAARIFADVQHLRDTDGSYWTGWVFDDRAIWPEERTTWTAGVALLAAAALAGDPATTAVFGLDDSHNFPEVVASESCCGDNLPEIVTI